MSASSKPLFSAIRLASTEVTYWPQILPLFITALPLARVKPLIMQRMPFLMPSSPRYEPHSNAAIAVRTGGSNVPRPSAPDPR